MTEEDGKTQRPAAAGHERITVGGTSAGGCSRAFSNGSKLFVDLASILLRGVMSKKIKSTFCGNPFVRNCWQGQNKNIQNSTVVKAAKKEVAQEHFLEEVNVFPLSMMGAQKKCVIGSAECDMLPAGF